MPITSVGQLFTPRNAAELRDQMLRDMRLAAIDADVEEPPVQPGTDWHLLATGVANLCLIGFANIAIGLDAQNVLTATEGDLEAIRIGYQIPEVAPTGSTGKLTIRTDGAVTIVQGQQFVLPNGLRGEVSSPYVNPPDNSDIDVRALDPGSATNFGSGEVVQFVGPPTNLRTEAKVSQGAPLTGGTDAEKDERKRARILDTLRNKPAGGNWSHVRQIALAALGTVSDCYSYPALGGAGSSKTVAVKDFDVDNNDFSRALTASALQTVRSAVQSQLPTPQENLVETVVDVDTDVTIAITIPSSSLSGGNGLGWTDPQPWPPAITADSGTIEVTAVSVGNDQLTLDAATTTAPVNGQTHIAWWSAVDRRFYTALVVAHSGSTGAWVVTLDRALVSKDGSGPAVGDYVCPAAQNLDAYGMRWVDMFRTLGPGENTDDTNRLPRSLRHPFTTAEDPSDLTATTIASWRANFPEISNYALLYAPVTSPSVPGLVSESPNILRPRRFAVYPQ